MTNRSNEICVSNSNQNVHKENFTNITASWVKFGEVFCNELEQPIFICAVCLQNADSVNTAYSTEDLSVLLWHVKQQHRNNSTTEYETIDNISAEIQNYQTNSGEGFGGETEISNDEINANAAQPEPPVDREENKIKQNQIKKLNEFREFLNSEKAQTKEEVDDELMETSPDEENVEEAQENFNHDANCNQHNNINEGYTISDNENEKGMNCINQEYLGMRCERNVVDYLKHNDMIEISDDDDVSDNENQINEPVNSMESNTNPQPSEIQESVLPQIISVTTIPTPDPSPCSVLGYEYQANQTPEVAKKKTKPVRSRAFKCNVCGTSTINKINMEKHFKLSHTSLSHELWINPDFHNLYHRIEPSDKNINIRKRLFKCDTCNRTTSTQSAMNRHQQFCHGPNTDQFLTQCNICHIKCLTSNLNLHMQTHFSMGYNWNHLTNINRSSQAGTNFPLSRYQFPVNPVPVIYPE